MSQDIKEKFDVKSHISTGGDVVGGGGGGVRIGKLEKEKYIKD